VLLALLGVAAATLRTTFPAAAAARVEPVRTQLFERLHLVDPFADERPAELARSEGRYAPHPWLIVTHSVAGGLFLLAAPFQFSRRIRRDHLRWHRWSGRVLLLLGFPFVLTALYFGVLIPYGGPLEALLVAIIGALFMTSATRAWLAIRRRDIARHREWMLRMFASAISISTVRAVAVPLDLALTVAGLHIRTIFVITLWAGWILTLGAAELWIRRSRADSPSHAATP